MSDPGIMPDALSRGLHALLLRRDAELRERYQRSLPFADAMFDRWERARRLGFGEGASIYDSSSVFGDVRVGEQTWVGPNTLLDGSGGALTIGAFCAISSGVHLYTHDTVAWALSGGTAPFKTGATVIGDRVYIGSQCVIAAGVSIGDQCVIGANSFVNRDVPPRTIVGGSPAHRIGRVYVDGGKIGLRYDDGR